MFEIPDDDENFWEELPLEDITNSKQQLQTSIKDTSESFTCGVKRLSSESADYNHNKRHRPGHVKSPPPPRHTCRPGHAKSPPPPRNTWQLRAQNSPTESHKDNCSVSALNHCHTDSSKSHSSHPDNIGKSLKATEDRVPAVSQHIVNQQTNESVIEAHMKKKTRNDRNVATPARSHDSDMVTPAKSHDSHVVTPSRGRRKFPGPAGLLPKINPGSIKNNTCMNTQCTSPEVVKQDDVILSSQSGDEVFNDTPWQTLLQDLGEGSKKLINQFSIATSLQMTKKKLLPKGKVPLVLGVIESVEWQGSDASICLKDRSGKIRGTVHHSLMKDHHCDLQPGTAIVIRQVSMISPTARNHYLNITPSNIVAIYSNSANGLKVDKSFISDMPLSSALSNVDPFLIEESNGHRLSGLNTPTTPVATTGLRPTFDSPRTPVAINGHRPGFDSPRTSVVCSDQNQGLSHYQRSNVTPRPNQTSCLPLIRTPQNVPPVNGHQMFVPRPSSTNGPCTIRPITNGPSCDQPFINETPQRSSSSNTFKFVKTPSLGSAISLTPSHSSAMNMLKSNDDRMNLSKSDFIPSSNDVVGKHRKTEISGLQESPLITTDSGSAKKSFKFKSLKSNTSPSQGNILKTLKEPPRPCLEADSLWQDDLSDDLLSQLSEEMI